MLTYVFITFPRNAYHIHGSSQNSLAYVNIFHARLLAPSGGLQGSSMKAYPPHHDVCWLTFASAQTQF